MLFHLIASLLLLTQHAVVSVQNEFLKEIITGRCYFNPPSGDVSSCPSLVGSIMGVLEGHLDASIEPAFFDNYFDAANFLPTNKGGLFWMKEDDYGSTIWVPPGWNTPETTPGGALMAGLDFCGVDLRCDCPSSSGASEAFWEAAYAAYAQSVVGDVFILVEGNFNLDSLLNGAFPQLSLIPSVTIFATDCEMEEVDAISRAAFEHSIGSGNIECIDSVEFWILCQDSRSSVCQCLRQPGEEPMAPNTNDPPPENAVAPIPQKVSTPTNVSTTNTSTGSSDTVGQSSAGVETSGSTYKVMFWLTLIVFSMGFYYTTRRQMMSGYDEISTTNIQQVLPPKQ